MLRRRNELNGDDWRPAGYDQLEVSAPAVQAGAKEPGILYSVVTPVPSSFLSFRPTFFRLEFSIHLSEFSIRFSPCWFCSKIFTKGEFTLIAQGNNDLFISSLTPIQARNYMRYEMMC